MRGRAASWGARLLLLLLLGCAGLRGGLGSSLLTGTGGRGDREGLRAPTARRGPEEGRKGRPSRDTGRRRRRRRSAGAVRCRPARGGEDAVRSRAEVPLSAGLPEPPVRPRRSSAAAEWPRPHGSVPASGASGAGDAFQAPAPAGMRGAGRGRAGRGSGWVIAAREVEDLRPSNEDKLH